MEKNRDYFSELMQSIKKSIASNISVMYLAKIVKLEPPTADLQPLAKIDGKKQSMIYKAHFLITPNYKKLSKEEIKDTKLDYKKGDVVVVGSLDHDDMYFKNDLYNVDTERIHSADFAVILGRYARKDDFKGGD
ncbi:hypothetical protein [Apilactobacillus timberlakei]|uniref:hypothetical protein n=1 Tax=Apilactobacillus timberlakei TaxID=2008380 RepID=UPI001126CA74|nr:hypothetical protein [Apilactobacillus timberlakei]TPR12236.1 hypothetical protein DYZ97_07080 [Apilactobacillus timberlakei]